MVRNEYKIRPNEIEHPRIENDLLSAIIIVQVLTSIKEGEGGEVG